MIIGDYCTAFGLTSEPFSKEIADSDLWMPPSKQAVLDDLVDAVHTRKSGIVTGEPGAGKTCLLRGLRHALSGEAMRLTYYHNVTLGRRDFYRHLCLALGLPKTSHSAGDVFMAISTHIEELAKERTFPVLLIDEAHLLHQDTLDHLHILLNYAWDSKSLLSLILVGLPELEDRMRLRRNRSLYSRMHYRLATGNLMPEDTADYVRTRLQRAGGSKELFANDAVALIHEASAGSLRETDRIATAALRATARRKRKTIERDVVSRILQQDER